jgi:5-methylcytosine-specific restriction endonuclease McrA
MQKVSKQKLINALCDVNKNVDGQLSFGKYKDMKPKNYLSESTIVRHFGSWNKAKEEAGLKTSKYNNDKYSKNECLNFLESVYRKTDGRLTATKYNENKLEHHPNASIIAKKFNTWNDAKSELNLKINVMHELVHTKEDILNTLKKINEKVKGNLSCLDYKIYRDDDDPSHVTITNRFGSWNKAKKSAGLCVLEWKSSSISDYGSQWYKIREQIIRRDNYSCCMCGHTNTEHKTQYNQGLHVHHIRKLKSYLSIFLKEEITQIKNENVDEQLRRRFERRLKDANRSSNLVTLCRNCHNQCEEISINEQINVYRDSMHCDSSNLEYR